MCFCDNNARFISQGAGSRVEFTVIKRSDPGAVREEAPCPKVKGGSFERMNKRLEILAAMLRKRPFNLQQQLHTILVEQPYELIHKPWVIAHALKIAQSVGIKQWYRYRFGRVYGLHNSQ